MRRVALTLGERLTSERVISKADDIFFLTIDEAIVLAESDTMQKGKTDRENAINLIAERRQQFERDSQLAPPDQFECPPGENWAPGLESTMTDDDPNRDGPDWDRCLRRHGEWTCCSGSDATEAHSLSDTPILVTRQTDPGWASVFFMVKGLVVERGGMLSHGAIIAREYGIPAVVGVKGATQRIRHGNKVHIDGSKGKVTFAHD